MRRVKVTKPLICRNEQVFIRQKIYIYASIISMKNINSFLIIAVLLNVCFSACHSLTKNKGKGDQEQADMRIKYDDSTLNNRTLPIVMPYNRLIDPAGKVVKFGNPG